MKIYQAMNRTNFKLDRNLSKKQVLIKIKLLKRLIKLANRTMNNPVFIDIVCSNYKRGIRELKALKK